MRTILIFCIWLLSAVRCRHPKIHITAQEGGLVKIACHYDQWYKTYPKHFSKGIYGKRQILIKTTKVSALKDKYSYFDDTKQRILHVTIYNLNGNDGGTYWCEIHKNGYKPKTEIELKVYKAPPPTKPPLVTSHPPVSTTVQTITRNQQQPTRTTESVSSTSLWSTPPEDILTVLIPRAGNELYLAVVGAVVLLSLLVFLFLGLRKQGQETERAAFNRDTAPWMNTWSTVIYEEKKNTCSIRGPHIEAGDQHIGEDNHLLYSTVCFTTVAQPHPPHSRVIKHRHLKHVRK